jgi:type I restriction enzyme M protein
MPNSASDARNSEYEIRKKIVDSGIVDCMVSMPSNMFFTVTLPATLWFFDKQKVNTERKDKILFLDARNVYYQIDRAHREWTEEQQQNLAAIVRLYRGEADRYLELINSYLQSAASAKEAVLPSKTNLEQLLKTSLQALKSYVEATKEEKRTPAKAEVFAQIQKTLSSFAIAEAKQNKATLDITIDLLNTSLDNQKQHLAANYLNALCEQNTSDVEALKQNATTLSELFKLADQNAKLKSDKHWTMYELARTDKRIETALVEYTEAIEQTKYWYDNIHWLQKRFPEAKYQDVIGLCKMADRTEYAEEQDYSLNAGRYVGVEIKEIAMSIEEYRVIIEEKNTGLNKLNLESIKIESLINENIKHLFSEIK